MAQEKSLLVRMGLIDRHYIYIVMVLVVVFPLLAGFHFTAVPSEHTLRFDAALDKAISADAPIMIGVDFGPQTVAEMEPILLAVMHKLFYVKKKVIFLTFMPETCALMHTYLARMEKQYGLTYGEDYAFLGFGGAYFVTINGMGTSIEEHFHEDDRGTPLGELAIMKGVKKINDVSAVINIASNTMPRHWITWGVAPFGFDFLMATTATQATDYFPYLQTGQVKGIITGGRAGAEYEGMLMEQGVLSEPGSATRGLGSQSLALMTIIVFIIVGNIGYFASRRKGRER